MMNINQTIKLGMAVIALIAASAIAQQAQGQVVLVDHHLNELHMNTANNVALAIGTANRNLHLKILNSSQHTVPSG